MSQPRAILKNTVVLGLSTIVEKLSSVYVGIWVARRLGAGPLGSYSVAMAYYGLLFLAAELGSGTYLVREIAKDRSLTSRLVVHTIIMSTVLGMLLAAVVLVVLPSTGFSGEMRRALAVVVWATVPATWKAILESVFVAYQRADFLTYVGSLVAIINAAGAVYLLAHRHGVVSLVVVFTIAQLLAAVFYLLALNRYILKLKWEFVPGFARKVLRDVRPFTGTSLVQGFLSRPEMILLSFMKNDAQIGFYGAALKVVDLWQLIPRSFMTTVFPVLTSYYHSGHERTYIVREKSIKYLLAVSFPVTAGLFITAQPVLHLLYGNAFSRSIVDMRILVWAIPLGSLWSVLWRVLSARGEHHAALEGQVVTLLLRLAAGYALIRSFGSVGAAISTTTAMLVLDLLLLLKVRRDGSRTRLVKLGGRSALAAGSMGLVTLFIRDHLHLWAVVCVSAAVYVGMTFLLRTFAEDDISLFRSLWRVRNA